MQNKPKTPKNPEIKEIYISFQNEKATLEWSDGISVYILNPL